MAKPKDTRAKRPQNLLVWTRKLDGEPMAGRLRTMHGIRQALGDGADIVTAQLPDVLTDMSLRRLMGVGWGWLSHLFAGRLLPLQCALFANAGDHDRIIKNLPTDLDAVYLDGVRSFALLERLRRARPDLRIVVDLDDLISRRMALLIKAGQPLSPGYLTKHLPGLVQKFAMSRAIGRLIVDYERVTLAAVERHMASLADVLVLVSTEDARILESLCAPDPRAKIVVMPPSRELMQAPKPISQPIRFVFIGSDALTQNWLTIEYLTGLWAKHKFSAELVLFGLRSRAAPLPPNVRSAGYVDDLCDVYDGRSVMLTPSFIGGGVKSKVLEAFSYGAPVIGNPMTFESMPLGEYALNLSEEDDLVRILSLIHISEPTRPY